MIFSKLRAFLKKICQCVSIVNFFQPNYSKGKIYVLQHFKKTTIYKILSHSGIYKVLIRFDLNGIINWIKKCAQEINTEIITSMFKNLKPKIHQAIKFGLTRDDSSFRWHFQKYFSPTSVALLKTIKIF